MNKALAFILLSTCVITASCQPRKSEIKMQVVDYGRFSVKGTSDVADPSLLMSKRFEGGTGEIIERTAIIPATLGTVFCLRFVLEGRPEGEPSQVKIVARYPSPGIPDPKTRVLHIADEYEVPMFFGRAQSTCYKFETAEEMVAGKWVREVWYQGKKLGEQEFTVVPSKLD